LHAAAQALLNAFQARTKNVNRKQLNWLFLQGAGRGPSASYFRCGKIKNYSELGGLQWICQEAGVFGMAYQK